MVKTCVMAAVMAAGPVWAAAQPAADGDRVMQVVRAALAPALPFPDSDDSGALPADGAPEPLWMVRPLQPGDHTIEVLANPLNEINQARATRAMAQIGAAIDAAQRRAEQQYERAIAEAKRTGRSQDVDGVGLSDEGVAGARIDAEAQVTIEVAFNQPSYRHAFATGVAPAPAGSVPGAVAVMAVPSNVFRATTARGGEERYAAAETLIYFGALAAPAIRERDDAAYEVTTAARDTSAAVVRSLVVRLRGNETLIADLVRKADWPRVLELLR